jgi:hypothetical protein
VAEISRHVGVRTQLNREIEEIQQDVALEAVLERSKLPKLRPSVSSMGVLKKRPNRLSVT